MQSQADTQNLSTIQSQYIEHAMGLNRAAAELERIFKEELLPAKTVSEVRKIVKKMPPALNTERALGISEEERQRTIDELIAELTEQAERWRLR